MIEVLLQAESALSLGLLDQAEILYRQVVIADPRNSIAVVGLARVALERGDEPGALAQARRALAIDGENAAAQRMVQRLEEVLAYRGEPAASSIAPQPIAPKPAPTTPAMLAEPAVHPAAKPADDPAPTQAPAERRSWLARIVRRKS
jgi:tetratricopeptide (TPR) repeat protein